MAADGLPLAIRCLHLRLLCLSQSDTVDQVVVRLLDLPDTVVCDHVHARDGLQRLRPGRVQGLSS